MKVKRKQRISVRSAKNKGKGFQNLIRDFFLELLRSSTLRNFADGNDDIESRQMGGAGRDIIFHNRTAKRALPYYSECKQGKRGFNPHQIFDKLTELATADNKKPILFHRRDHHETLVTMSLETYKWLEEERLSQYDWSKK